MHRVDVKSYSGRLEEEEEEEEEERWMKCMGSDIQNTDYKRDSGKVKGCNQCGCICTAHLDGPNCLKLWHNEGIRWTTYQCLLDAIWNSPDVTADSGEPTGLPSCACTAVYPSSWNCINSVCKVANTTLQYLLKIQSVLMTTLIC